MLSSAANLEPLLALALRGTRKSRTQDIALDGLSVEQPFDEVGAVYRTILSCFAFSTAGAGLIKIRGDKAWKDLTAMEYHYETQPLPNPISYFLHQAPKEFHR